MHGGKHDTVIDRDEKLPIRLGTNLRRAQVRRGNDQETRILSISLERLTVTAQAMLTIEKPPTLRVSPLALGLGPGTAERKKRQGYQNDQRSHVCPFAMV